MAKSCDLWENIQQLQEDLGVLEDLCSPEHQEDPVGRRGKVQYCMDKVRNMIGFRKKKKEQFSYLDTNSWFSLITLSHKDAYSFVRGQQEK